MEVRMCCEWQPLSKANPQFNILSILSFKDWVKWNITITVTFSTGNLFRFFQTPFFDHWYRRIPIWGYNVNPIFTKWKGVSQCILPLQRWGTLHCYASNGYQTNITNMSFKMCIQLQSILEWNHSILYVINAQDYTTSRHTCQINIMTIKPI